MSELAIQDKEGNATKVIAVEMRNDDRVNRGRIDAEPLHRYQR
jgi:hypothetical protein